MKIRDRIKAFRRIKGRDLIPHPKNWRTHPQEQQDALRGILAEIGIAGALLARETKAGVQLIDGHARGEIAPDTEWPVLILDVTEAEAEKLLVTFDPLTSMAGLDKEKLTELLAGITFESEALRTLTQQLIDPMPTGGPAVPQDEVPDLPKKAVTKPGDLWTLGRHRLLCGDSTQRQDVQKLMGRATASLLLTDPPYNVGYVGKTAEALEIDNDRMDESAYRSFLLKALEAALTYLKPGGVFYIWHADIQAMPVMQAMQEAGLQTRQWLIWVKNCMVLCRKDYQFRHEPCLCGQKDSEGKAADKNHEPCLTGWKDGAAHRWLNDRCQTTVLEYDKPSRSEQHPTMKPLPLWAYLIGNSCPKGEIVLDPFCGSGTTIAAAEGTERTGYCLELDPLYCDVVVDRWQALTGQKATRGTGPARPPKKKKKSKQKATR